MTVKLNHDDIGAIDWQRRLREFDEALDDVRDLFSFVREMRAAFEPFVDGAFVSWLDEEGQAMLLEQLQSWRKLLEQPEVGE